MKSEDVPHPKMSGGHIEFFTTSPTKLFFWKTEARFSKKKEI